MTHGVSAFPTSGGLAASRNGRPLETEADLPGRNAGLNLTHLPCSLRSDVCAMVLMKALPVVNKIADTWKHYYRHPELRCAERGNYPRRDKLQKMRLTRGGLFQEGVRAEAGAVHMHRWHPSRCPRGHVLTWVPRAPGPSNSMQISLLILICPQSADRHSFGKKHHIPGLTLRGGCENQDGD